MCKMFWVVVHSLLNVKMYYNLKKKKHEKSSK
jgi:hypothetical protein